MRMILAFLVVLAGCGERVVALHDDWLDSFSLHTVEYEIYRDQFAIVEARPIVVTSSDGVGYAVLLNVRRRDANGPKINQITSGTVSLNYSRHDRKRTHCIDGCQRAELGAIHFSKRAFEIAAHTGLPLRIWGQRARYDGIVPADAFAQVLSRISQSD